MQSERLIQNPKHSGDRANGNNNGPHRSKLRAWAGIVPHGYFGHVETLPDYGRSEQDRNGLEVSLPRKDNGDASVNLHLAIPGDLGHAYASAPRSDRSVLRVVSDRVLDVISHKENVLRTVNYLCICLFLVLSIRTILAVDLESAVISLAAGTVPLILYFLKVRADRRAQQKRRDAFSADRIFELAERDRQRLDEGMRHLRDEERAFTQRQIERYGKMAEIARRRSHLYANAFSGIELANHQLVEILDQARIGVPSMLRGGKIRESLWMELEKLNTEEADVHYDLENDTPPVSKLK